MEIEANLIFIQYSISIYINLYILPLLCPELSVKNYLGNFAPLESQSLVITFYGFSKVFSI